MSAIMSLRSPRLICRYGRHGTRGDCAADDAAVSGFGRCHSGTDGAGASLANRSTRHTGQSGAAGALSSSSQASVAAHSSSMVTPRKDANSLASVRD
jgi:hypothetical protein